MKSISTPSPLDRRSAGVLLHPTSLPAPFGIGDLGPAARQFIDRLAAAGQSWWQMLPLNPPAAGNSPYACDSAFAGNPLLISPEDLAAEGFLPSMPPPPRVASAARVDFNRVAAFKAKVLSAAWRHFAHGAAPALRDEFARFREEHRDWLEDYALFAALAEAHGTRDWKAWPRPLAMRTPSALRTARAHFQDAIDQQAFYQLLFFRQLASLHHYARARGVGFLADLPIFVSGDSADVWSHRNLFQLDAHARPRVVAGVPPDAFSKTGQRWGNPLYHWDAMKRDGYAWWIARIQAVLRFADAVRIDHFRGFSACWEIPARSPTAIRGAWVPAAGADLLQHVEKTLGSLPLIAEDLGVITPDVEELRDRFALPGMRVLQFAFDGNPENPHLPFHHPAASVAYTGTHDNPTTLEWFQRLPRRDKPHLLTLAPEAAQNPSHTLLRLTWLSPARTAIAPLQDLLNLGAEARMNVPGRPRGNWGWRWTPTAADDRAFQMLRDLTVATNRASDLRRPASAAS